jgi:hypothetical protein
MVLELGGIDLSVVEASSGNTPLLMLAKVVQTDGPEEISVAGATAVAAHHARLPRRSPPLFSAAAMLNKGVKLRARDKCGHDSLCVVLRRRLPHLQVGCCC